MRLKNSPGRSFDSYKGNVFKCDRMKNNFCKKARVLFKIFESSPFVFRKRFCRRFFLFCETSQYGRRNSTVAHEAFESVKTRKEQNK